MQKRVLKKNSLRFNKIILFFLFIAFAQFYGQIHFNGVVSDEKNNPLVRARVFVKTTSLSKYAFTDTNGNFSINFDSIDDGSVLLIASYTGYKNDSIMISVTKELRKYNAKLKLVKQTKSIDEVVLIKRKPIEIKKDTVAYNAENFLDGSEKNVEDLLKKLPGINVKEDGSLEFKGKAVVAVMLDGADLFNSNYMIGTKGINPQIVDQVEAIESWSENPILKNLNAERKVALNLKLKKDKSSFSSGINLETNFQNRNNIGGNVLIVNSLIKTFQTINYNNIGENKSPINTNHNSLSFEDFQNMSYQTPFIINANSIDTQFGEDKTNRNQQKFGSSNSIIKLSDKANVKVIGSIVKDKILINNTSENFYNLNAGAIFTKDENEIIKYTNYYTGGLELNWNKSKKDYFKFIGSLSSMNEDTENNLISNSNKNYSTNKNTKYLFSKNVMEYTYKLMGKKALQLRAIYTYNSKPQNLWISPSLPFYTTTDSLGFNLQNVNLSKEHLGVEMKLYNVFSENHNFTITTGLANRKFSLDSKFKARESHYVEDFYNNLHYKTNALYLDFDYFFKNERWGITFKQKNQFLHQNINEKTQIIKNIFLNDTSLMVFRLLFNKTSGFINAQIISSPINEKYLYSNKILVSNRDVISNDFTLDAEKRQYYQLGFSYNDSFLSQFKAIFSGGYSKTENNFASQYLVDSNINFTQNYRSKKPSESYNITLNIEKFISFISSRFNLKTSYVLSDYYYDINNYSTTKIYQKTFNIDLIHQIAFNFPLKIKNTFKYLLNMSHSEISNQNKNQLFVLKNEIVYSFHNNVYVFNFNNEYYKPDFKQTSDLLFFNFNFNYSPKNSKFKYFLSLKNMLNQKFILTKSIQDYSASTSITELLPRMFLIGGNVNF